MASEDPEHVHGEVVDAVPPVGPASFPVPTPQRRARQMTGQQFQAAVADSAGMERRDIAKLVAVSESTIKNWRSMPEYQAEVERLRDTQAEMIAEPVAQMREELITGTRAAIRSLILQLDAEDAKGKPLWSQRDHAAELLLKSGLDLHREQVRRSQDAGPQSPAQAVQINLNLGDGPPDSVVA